MPRIAPTHMSAVDHVRAMRAQDNDATAAWPKCHPGTQHAVQVLKQQGALHEADILQLAHTMQTIVERGGNQLMPHWAAIISDLESLQAGCSDAINDEAESDEAQRYAGI